MTKMGDRYLRKLLFVGACATLRHALRLCAMLDRKTVKYKFELTADRARQQGRAYRLWLMTRGGQYDELLVAA